jgi:hypothetical protein
MFTCGIGESSPLLKHKQGLCFHHIMKVWAIPFLLQNLLRERTAHREHFFHPFGSTSDAQEDPRPPKGYQKEPKRIPKASPGTFKIHQKSTWDPTLALKGAQAAPGVPPGRMCVCLFVRMHVCRYLCMYV